MASVWTVEPDGKTLVRIWDDITEPHGFVGLVERPYAARVAAAPAMLTALRALVDACESFQPLREPLAAARAAIAEATTLPTED